MPRPDESASRNNPQRGFLKPAACAVVVRVNLPADPAELGQPRVDGRTARQWLKAALSYCNYRSGDNWRNLADRRQRDDDERWYYLHGARFLLAHLTSPETRKGPLPCLPALETGAYSPTPFEYELAKRPRAELVDLLMNADERLSDRRLLLRLTRIKLARLVVEAKRRALPERRIA